MIDDGYDWYREHCVIKADTESEAKKFLLVYVDYNLKGEKFIVDSQTIITKAIDEPIIYNSWNR